MIYDEKLLDTKFNEIVGDELKKLRIKNNYSLQEASNKINNKVSRQTIFHYENKETKIRRDIFIDLCKVYKITPKKFLENVLFKYIKSL